MTELCRHIGQFTDVPAGDIGVGGREIGFMFGQYKRVRNEFIGVLTGKGLNWGGSLIRPEATGYGAVYFAAEMLATRGETLEGKTCLVSGSGNVAQYAIEKILDLGGKPVTFSRLRRLHLRRGRHRPRRSSPSCSSSRTSSAAASASTPTSTRAPSSRRVDKAKDFNPLWDHKADCAFPSATQNEINAKDAANLVKNGVYVVSEGANMPTVPEGVDLFVEKASSTAPARPPTPAAWPPPASRCRRTACA